MILESLFNKYKDLFLSAEEWNNMLIQLFGVSYYVILLPLIELAINYYDKSIYVNAFNYAGKLYWLSKETRMGLIRLIDSGASDITLLLNNTTYIEIKASKLKEFLDNLEIYAGKCFSTTAKHIQELYKCVSIEELISLDYTKDYPEKLTLSVD